MQPERAQSRFLFPTGMSPRCWRRPLSPRRTLPSLTLAGLILLLAVIGCGRRVTSPPLPDKLLHGLVVTVACPGEPATTIVHRYGRLWTAQTGANVKVVPYDAATGPDAGPAADLWVVSPARMPHWADSGRLLPVPAEAIEQNPHYAWQNILPLYRSKLCVWDQKVYALPLLGDALLCFYRQDLFQLTEHRKEFKSKYGRDLVPPATWEQFMQIADYFNNQKRPGINRPCPSLPPLPDNPDDLDRTFYSVAAPFARRAVREDDPHPPAAVELFSFHYDLKSGAVRIGTAGFVHALKILQHMQQFRPAGTAPDPPAVFQRGEAVLCLAGPAWISRFQESPVVRDKFGLCRMPGSEHVFDYATGGEQALPSGNWVPYLGADGWLMVVPRSTKQPEAAFALAAFLSEPKTSLDIVIEPAWGGGVYRREHLEPGVGWQQLGLDRKSTEHLVDILRETLLHPQVKNPVLRLRTPDERSHQLALDAQLRAALLDGKEAGQALQTAAEQWRQIDKEKNTAARIAAYRLSLGLIR
jgi:multiple sugar transport system substrate-binding protein